MRTIIAAVAALCLVSASPMRYAAAPDMAVDVALVLAVDASSSMEDWERKMQREGYASAVTSRAVLKSIADGKHHRIAVTMFEWGSSDSRHEVVPWMIIDGEQSAQAAADLILDVKTEDLSRTSISSALDYAGALLAGSGFSADRQVIDVDGDGPNNEGRVVSEARDDLVKRGIVINGLPIIKTASGSGIDFLIMPDLDDYYDHCVIGGEGSFMIAVRGMGQFAQALQTKLVTEIAGIDAPSRVIPAASTGRDWSRDGSCHLYE